MLARRQLGAALGPLVGTWQAASGVTAAAAAPPSLPMQQRGAHRRSRAGGEDADAQHSKQERRAARRRRNRDLKERLGVCAFGWHWGDPAGQVRGPCGVWRRRLRQQASLRPLPRGGSLPCLAASHHCHKSVGAQVAEGKARSRSSAAAAAAEPSDAEEDGWGMFAAVLGRPRSAAERRKFARLWKQWQRAGEKAEASSGSSNGWSSRRSSSSNPWSSHSSSSSNPWSSHSSSSSSSTWSSSSSGGASSSSGSGSSWRGTAGTSAGPRWGRATWTWEDMGAGGSSGSSSSGSGGFASGDHEAWYDVPPPGSSRRRAAGASSAWGWQSASWQSGGGAWQSASGDWYFNGTSWGRFSFGAFGGGGGWGGATGAASGGGGSAGSTATHGHLQLLGLSSAWLSGRCGKALRRAYLAAAKREHPDMHGGTAASAAKERFVRVQAAYEALLALVRPG